MVEDGIRNYHYFKYLTLEVLIDIVKIFDVDIKDLIKDE